MKDWMITLLIVLGISLFCGFVVIAVGMGSLFPQMNQVARPVVCGDGEMQVKQYVNHYRPGETSWSISAYCLDSNGKKDVTGFTQLVAGIIYSGIPFVLIMGWILLARLRNGGRPVDTTLTPTPRAVPSAKFEEDEESDDIQVKLAKLKKLRDSNLITEEDYEKKKNKLLDKI